MARPGTTYRGSPVAQHTAVAQQAFSILPGLTTPISLYLGSHALGGGFVEPQAAFRKRGRFINPCGAWPVLNMGPTNLERVIVGWCAVVLSHLDLAPVSRDCHDCRCGELDVPQAGGNHARPVLVPGGVAVHR